MANVRTFQSPCRRSHRALWRAVVARDARYDGGFVYAVRSTGIYCRPSCPARRPSRELVSFFDSPEAAERKGFRACRRCHPQNGSRIDDWELIGRACRAIESDTERNGRLTTFAREAGLKPARLQRMFRRLMGISPGAYAQALRLGRLKKRLREGNDVTTALYEAGYGSSRGLYERSNSQLGMTPGTYGRGGQGMEIGYAVMPSPLGRLLVAGTVRGVSAIYLGDADAPLEAELRREYPEAKIQRSPAQVSRWIRQLVRHLHGRQAQLDLPVDIQATAFQRRVWAALQGIARGSSRSYSQVARMIGRPLATRAVARACATNPLSILIPCHRVLRQDGGLGGYRWGIQRKQALLEAEKRQRRTLKKARAGPAASSAALPW